MAGPSKDMKKAVAMAYRSSVDDAPRVVAKGCGVSAEAIISLARESGVYVHQSPELVNLLMQVDLDHEIPPELYTAVAELLIWLWGMDQSLSGNPKNGSSSR